MLARPAGHYPAIFPDSCILAPPRTCYSIEMSNIITPEERKVISDRLAVVRDKLRANGATALAPTPEWALLRKEVVVLSKKLA